MDRQKESAQPHIVPSYLATSDAIWYHFLHGNVPGHQIDFMYRAEVPQGSLTRQHFSHLSRIMKYIEPQASAPYAFAVANLSRDDTQHEPGRGGLAMIFGHRVQGARDHAGRQDPPFAHAIAAVNREFTSASLLSSALAFYRSVLDGEPTYSCPSSLMYREYVRCLLEASHGVPEVLRTYLSRFKDLPRPAESSLSLRWLKGEAPQPSRVVIVHPDDAPFSAIAECASRIAGVLYQSDIRWTSITSGRELEVENGVTIRIVARRDASSFPSEERILLMSDVPEHEAGIAKLLFNASPLVPHPYSTAPVEGWKRPPRRALGATTGAEGPRGAEEPISGPEAPQEAERVSPSEPIVESLIRRIEGEATPEDKTKAPSNAVAVAIAAEPSADPCLTAALTPEATPVQETSSAPPKLEPPRAAHGNQKSAPSDGDGDDMRALPAPRRSRALIRFSMVLGGAAAVPFLYASLNGLSLGDGATLEGASSSVEPTPVVNRAEPPNPAEPERPGRTATSDAAGGPKVNGPKPPAVSVRPRGGGAPGKASAKPSIMSSATPPSTSASPVAAAPSAPTAVPTHTRSSIIGGEPLFNKGADGRQ